ALDADALDGAVLVEAGELPVALEVRQADLVGQDRLPSRQRRRRERRQHRDDEECNCGPCHVSTSGAYGKVYFHDRTALSKRLCGGSGSILFLMTRWSSSKATSMVQSGKYHQLR